MMQIQRPEKTTKSTTSDAGWNGTTADRVSVDLPPLGGEGPREARGDPAVVTVSNSDTHCNPPKESQVPTVPAIAHNWKETDRQQEEMMDHMWERQKLESRYFSHIQSFDSPFESEVLGWQYPTFDRRRAWSSATD